MKSSRMQTETAIVKWSTRRMFSSGAAIALCIVATQFSLPAPLSAQNAAVVSNAAHTVRTEVTLAANIEQFWTADRLLSARPIEASLRVAADGLPMVADSAAAFAGPAIKVNGGLPSVKVGNTLQKTLISAEALADQAAFEANTLLPPIAPEATSPFGARFTTSRVFPDAATLAYPYRTAGKLYFHDPRTGGNFVCSASVLRPRLIVTAGHCVTHPSTNAALRYFYTNFLFIPVYNNGSAPLGTWTPSQEWVTNAWYMSDGSVPNQQDVAMIIARDQGTKLGYVTGYLGYYTGQLANNNVTMLGYPCNLDSCAKMQETFAQTYQYGGNNTYIYGSAMKGGASGGPWIQDFGINPAGAPAGLLAHNYLVAVTSYGPVNTALMYLGASNLDSRFITLLNAACGPATTGNCN